MPVSNSFDFQIFHSISEVDSSSWDNLSAGQPFASHQWYRYGESVLIDCEPIYVIVYKNGEPLARATFWRTANEPLPMQPAFIRQPFLRYGIQSVLERWPLLICRSPLSGTSGLILPETPLREAVQAAIAIKAEDLVRQTKCSFALFDFLPKKQALGWPKAFSSMANTNSGTFMPIEWNSFEEYLASNKKVRRHYQYMQNKARDLGVTIKLHKRVDQVDEAMQLIRRIEKHFEAAPNPWIRGMMEHLEMVNGTWVTTMVDNQLVGCNIILEDGSAHMNTGLGHNDLPFVYLIMMYENLKVAFDHHTRLIRWGSGAYEFKERLGLLREDNNWASFTTTNIFLRRIIDWLGQI